MLKAFIEKKLQLLIVNPVKQKLIMLRIHTIFKLVRVLLDMLYIFNNFYSKAYH